MGTSPFGDWLLMRSKVDEPSGLQRSLRYLEIFKSEDYEFQFFFVIHLFQ